MARIGNRTAPGRYTLGTWKRAESPIVGEFDQQVLCTGRLTVIRCRYAAGSDFSSHFHPLEQVTIVEAGTLEFLIDGERLVVRAGNMIVVPPGVRHATRVVGGHHAAALNLFVEAANGKAGDLPRLTVSD